MRDKTMQEHLDELRAELAAEKARLDWLVSHNSNVAVDHECNGKWSAVSNVDRSGNFNEWYRDTAREAIDAAMGLEEPQVGENPLDDLMEKPMEILLGIKARRSVTNKHEVELWEDLP